MRFLLILPLFVLPLSLAEDPIQRAIKEHGEPVQMVLKIAEDGKSIDGVLKPLTFISSGSSGFVFEGIRMADSKPVAIKFINDINMDNAKREYEMYSYLKAINNSNSEKYGIPTVYYYGRWLGFIVTAFTKLEKTLVERMDAKFFNYDILLLIQQFIKQSKYIHSRGIRHDDIKHQNILTRGCESFLIDYDLASKMTEDISGTSFPYAPFNFHLGINRVARDDWESFLYVMCDMASVPLKWFTSKVDLKTEKGMENALVSVGILKGDREEIRNVIRKALKEDSQLQYVFLALADEALSDKAIPNYDKFNDIVTKVLALFPADQKCFSWTKSDPDREKIAESFARLNVDIKDLKIPAKFDEYKRFKYPKVDEKYFRSASGSSFGCKSLLSIFNNNN